MRIGIFSDIHGNIDAFRLVVKRMNDLSLDAHIFAGDLCGYYYGQNDVVEMLLELPGLIAVKGNHDQWFLECLKNSGAIKALSQKYGRSYERLVKEASPKTLAFIQSLPERYEDPALSLAVYHGSPWSPLEEYIYPTDSIERFASLPFRYVILGHTHYSMHRTVANVHIINPGSCGQPRDRKAPSFAVLNTESASVDFEFVPYDTRALLASVQEWDANLPYLKEVLTR
jgi:predicted phosphodiesterase